MQQLAALWSALQGKKTYLLSALAAFWQLSGRFSRRCSECPARSICSRS